jgi:tetratricopeptide (TPR) repeat protein
LKSNDLTDIFAIQSEIAQTIARKLSATLSPEEKKRIEQKPTQNLEAYALYLRGKELVQNVYVEGDFAGSVRDAVVLLGQAVHLDPNFTLAYCAATEAEATLYRFVDPTPERRALADAAVNNALRIQPDLPEVRLAYAQYLYLVFRDYEQARVQLAIARAGLPNSAGAIILAAWMDRRQGNLEKAIEEFNKAIALDPRNTLAMVELYHTLFFTRQYRAANQVFQRVIAFFPDQPMLKLEQAFHLLKQNGDESGIRSALAAVPKSAIDDTSVLAYRLYLALADRDWAEAKGLIEKMKEREDESEFAGGEGLAPVGCFSILLSRLEGERFNANPTFIETRQRLNEKVLKLPGNAEALSQLAVVDALLTNKETAISEGKAAVEMLPIFKDAVDGPSILANLAVVYAWAGELDLAFATLEQLKKTPSIIGYGDFKCDSLWTPLRNDPRFDKLLAELAPHD